MKVYVFADSVPCTEEFKRNLQGVFEKIAQTTDTRDLVVAAYMEPGQTWHGELTSTRLLSPQDFCRGRRSWSFIGKHGAPEGLPDHFFLVRLSLEVAGRSRTRP